MDESKPVKCKLCQTRYTRQQEWKKEFEKQHCATCRAFLKTLFEYEKAMQSLLEISNIKGYEVRIYLNKNVASLKMVEALLGKEQYEGERRQSHPIKDGHE